jgi:hypothetical protein
MYNQLCTNYILIHIKKDNKSVTTLQLLPSNLIVSSGMFSDV